MAEEMFLDDAVFLLHYSFTIGRAEETHETLIQQARYLGGSLTEKEN